MEGVPRIPMISFPLKRSANSPNFKPKLRAFISDHYNENPDSYTNELNELESLRSSSIHASKDFIGCSKLKQYFCQLNFLKNRFPLHEGSPIAVTFSWYDIFSDQVHGWSDIDFEMSCILYNIGALHTELSLSEKRQSSDAIKAACTHYQCSAWAFQHLRNNYQKFFTPDLSPDLLTVLINICLGQAQECILEKSLIDNRKSTIQAKISLFIIEYYQLSLKASEQLIKAEGQYGEKVIRSVKKWKKLIELKINYYTSITHLFRGLQSEDQQRWGERITFYRTAAQKLEATFKLAKLMEKNDPIHDTLQFTNDVIMGKLSISEKENEFIYHDKVPEQEPNFGDLKGVSLVKGLPLNINDLNISGPDIFQRLVPMEAHEASSLYSEEKAKLLRNYSTKIDEKNESLNRFLTIIQLDQLDLAEFKIPQKLIDACASLNANQDSIKKLIDLMTVLSGLTHDVQSNLVELREMMEDEQTKESEFQSIMGKRPPPPSAGADSSLSDLTNELTKYELSHKEASITNQQLHEAMKAHMSNLLILMKPFDELLKELPSPGEDISNSDEIKEMHRLANKVDEMCKQRDMLYGQLRDSIQSDDITKQLIIKKDEEQVEFFQEELKKHEKTTQLLDQNLLAQENIIRALTEANSNYSEIRKTVGETVKKRDACVQSLIRSYDVYDELIKKCNNGIEFYKLLDENVVKLMKRMKGQFKGRDEEREGKLKGFVGRIPRGEIGGGGSGSGSGPPALSYQGQPGQGGAAGGGRPKLKDFYQTPGYQNLSGGGGHGHGSTTAAKDFYQPPSAPGANLPMPHGGQYGTGTTFVSQPQAIGYHNPNPLPNSSINHPPRDTSQQLPHIPTSYVPVPSASHNTSVQPQPQQQQQPYGYSNYSTIPPYNIPPAPTAASSTNYNNYTTPSAPPPTGSGAYNRPSYPPPAAAPVPFSNTSSSQHPASAMPPSSSTNFQGYTYSAGGAQAQYGGGSTAQHYQPGGGGGGGVGAQYAGTGGSNAQQYYQPQQVVPTPQVPQNSMPQPVARPSPAGVPSAVSYPGQNIVPNASIQSQPPPPSQQQQYSNQIPSSYHQPQPQPTHYGNNQSSMYYNPTSSGAPTPTQGTGAGTGSDQLIYNHYAKSLSIPTTQKYIQTSIPQAPPQFLNQQPQPSTVQQPQPQHLHQQPQSIVGPNNQQQQYYNNAPQQQQQYYQHQQPNQQQQHHQQQQLPPNQSGGVISNTLQPMQQQQQPQQQPKRATNFDLLSDLDLSTNGGSGSGGGQLMQPLAPAATATTTTQQQQQVIESNSGQEFMNKSKSESDSTVTTTRTDATATATATVTNFDQLASSNSQHEQKSTTTTTPSQSPLKLIRKTRPKKPSATDPLSDPLQLAKFKTEVEKLSNTTDNLSKKSLNGPTNLDLKWKEIIEQQNTTTLQKRISIARCYPMKNRFPDILPFDENSVRLPTTKDDYINASYINDLSTNSLPFIITQSPLPSTYEDFWHMIWLESIELIVCLVSDIDLKTHIYWPAKKDVELIIGPFKIKLQTFNNKKFYLERILSITNCLQTRIVIHLQFLEWIGSTFPTNPTNFLSFINDVHNYQEQQRNTITPIVVHCLAGVGKSGVFSILSTAVKEIDYGNCSLIDLARCAILASQQRKGILIDKEYLKFCYHCYLYYCQDLLLKRGILSTTTFDDPAKSVIKKHTRHPSQDFLEDQLKAIRNEVSPSPPPPPPPPTEIPDGRQMSPEIQPDSPRKEPPQSQSPLLLTTNSSTKLYYSNLTNLDPTTFQQQMNEKHSKLIISGGGGHSGGGGSKKGELVFDKVEAAAAAMDLDDPLNKLDPMWSIKK